MRTTSHLLGWLEFFKKGPQQVLVRRRRIGTFIHCWWDHFPLEYSQGLKVLSTELSYSVAQSCPTLCDPMDCSPPGSSVHGISQARQRVSCHFLLQGSSRPRDWTHIFCISCIGGWILYQWATWKDRVLISPSNSTPRYLPQRSVNKSIQMCTWAVRAALFIIEKKWEQPQCPTTDVDKMGNIHTIEYYSIKWIKYWHALQHWWTLKTWC